MSSLECGRLIHYIPSFLSKSRRGVPVLMLPTSVEYRKSNEIITLKLLQLIRDGQE